MEKLLYAVLLGLVVQRYVWALGSEGILPKSVSTAEFYYLDYLRVCNLKL